jgi:iron complex outermembrane receptor protein
MAPDTLLHLPAVTISSSRIDRFAKGQIILVFDSLSRSQFPISSLAELAGNLSGAYIRNYGQGTLATISLRGSSANHTGIYWNGIRISPPNIGYVDLSLVQGVFFKDISMLYGGASPMFGSGAIGGSIHLENKPVFGQGSPSISAGLSAGSFLTAGFEGSIRFSGRRHYSSSAFALNTSRNDFPYENLSGQRTRLSHASFLRGGFAQDLAFKLKGDQYLSASLWFQYGDRNIPPTLTQSESVAWQLDRSWRALVSWKLFRRNNTFEGKAAFFDEYTLYSDSIADVYSVIRSKTGTGAFEFTSDLSARSSMFAGIQYTYEYADLDFYAGPEDQQALAVFASFRHVIPRWQWQFSLNGRQEFLTGFDPPFLLSAGFEGKVWRNLSASLNVSRNFRAPTLNERFWQPGGNPELDPEQSWNQEAGFSLRSNVSKADLYFGLTAYSSLVTGWILWLPGNGFWSVENAQKVWSRGFELSGRFSQNLRTIKLQANGSYTFSKSTNQEKQSDYDASYHKQLIYTPLHRFLIRSGISYSGYSLYLQGNYTGEIFTTRDNSSSLPGYFLLDALVSKAFTISQKYPATVQINVRNILNYYYEAVPYRPMPGVNFLVTLIFKIHPNTPSN